MDAKCVATRGDARNPWTSADPRERLAPGWGSRGRRLADLRLVGAGPRGAMRTSPKPQPTRPFTVWLTGFERFRRHQRATPERPPPRRSSGAPEDAGARPQECVAVRNPHTPVEAASDLCLQRYGQERPRMTRARPRAGS